MNHPDNPYISVRFTGCHDHTLDEPRGTLHGVGITVDDAWRDACDPYDGNHLTYDDWMAE